MKKLCLLFLISFIIFSSLNFGVEADSSIMENPNFKVEIDGKLSSYDSVPISINGRTLLPLREILINLGVQNDEKHIIWNNDEKSVTIYKGTTKIFLKIGDTVAKLNDTDVKLDAAPIVYKGKTYIPVRFVAQCLDKTVEYISQTTTVVIKSNIEKEINTISDKWISKKSMPFTNELGRVVLSNGGLGGSTIQWTESSDCAGKAVTVGNRIYFINGVGRVAIYDALSDVWIEKAEIPQLKDSMGFFKLVTASNKIYIVGNNFNEILEYDPTTEQTILKTKLLSDRVVGGVAAINNKIYVLGGIDKTSVKTLNTVEEYDLNTNTWSKKAGMSTSINRVTVTVLNNKIYALLFNKSATMGIEEFDPAIDRWTQKAQLGYLLISPGLEAIDDKIYLIGEGTNFKEKTTLSKVQVYDPIMNQWSPKSADMPTTRRGISTSACNGKIYVFGGYRLGSPNISDNTYSTNVDEYTP